MTNHVFTGAQVVPIDGSWDQTGRAGIGALWYEQQGLFGGIVLEPTAPDPFTTELKALRKALKQIAADSLSSLIQAYWLRLLQQGRFRIYQTGDQQDW